MPMYNVSIGANNTGLDQVLINISSNVPGLIYFILLFEFMVIAFAGTYGTKRAIGYANFLAWATIAGWVTTSSAVLLYLVPGIIDLTGVVICLVFTMLLTLLFMFSNREDD